MRLQEPALSGPSEFGTDLALLGFEQTTGGKVPSKKGLFMNKTILIGLIASCLFFTACTEEEVTSTIIGVGVGVGIGAIANDHDRHERHQEQDRRDEWNRRGGGYGPGRGGPGYGPGRGRGGYGAFIKSDVVAADTSVADFAEKYHITNEVSAKIQEAFATVATKGVSSFEAIGLTAQDLKQIAKKDVPSADSIKSMSAKLNLSEAQSTDLVKSMIAEFSKQAADVASPYWESCMASGKWRTAQNNYCSNTSWNGCSPATGATACY